MDGEDGLIQAQGTYGREYNEAAHTKRTETIDEIVLK
jgi:hypothetical protein